MKTAATVLVVDDDDAFRTVMSLELERTGFQVFSAANGATAIQDAARLEPAVVLLDLRLPDMSGLDVLRALREKSPVSEVIMLTGHGTIDTAIEAIRMGAFDYVGKPCPLDELEIRMQRALERQTLKLRTSILERGLTPPEPPRGSFAGESPAFRELMALVDRTAPSDSTVLVTGETGSGKEVVSKLLHAGSPRRARPFVVVECGALQESLLQSELFGHERGAFTGADRAKPGLFEVASGGTIFLDEIGEVSPSTQVKLLRVLDTSTFRHVGGTKEIHVDVRVLAATNRDLRAMVRQGQFREDLYYRLSTITITVPPLRERRSDVGLLARHFASRLAERTGATRAVSPAAVELLERHSWPGNVRELLHVVEAAMVACDGPEILPEHLPVALRTAAVPEVQSPAAEPSNPEELPTLEALERAHIEKVIRATQGHRARAAKILGISERNLYRKLGGY